MKSRSWWVWVSFGCAAIAGGVGIAHVTRGRAERTAGATMSPALSPLRITPASTITSTSTSTSTTTSTTMSTAADGVTGAVETGPPVNLSDGMVITGSTPHRMILFTFDDGPDWRTTPRLLDLLDQEGIKGVFFLTTSRITGDSPRTRVQAEIAREARRRGHVIASHARSHVHLTRLDDVEAAAEIDGATAAIERAVGERPWLIRPPFGAHSPRIDNFLAARGYTTMMWNLGTGDVFVRTPEAVVDTWRRVFERVERENGDRGGVVLLHDIHPWSVEAFPRIVADLRTRNCDLLERNEELYDIVEDPALFFTPRGDAPIGTLAPPAMPSEDVIAARQSRLRDETASRCRTLASR